MEDVDLAKTTEISPDEHFVREEQFSDWLRDHLDEIGELLGISIESGEREVPSGRYSTDIVAVNADSDSGDEKVIIENQLKQSDHDHLGKLITYAKAQDAKTIIWITPKFTDEHLEALQWLNENSNDKISFFGITLQLIKIQDSPVAPIFSVVVQPPYWEEQIVSEVAASSVGKARLKLQQCIIDEFKKIASLNYRARARPKITLHLGHVGKNFDLMCQHHHKHEDNIVVGMRIRKLHRPKEEIQSLFEKLKKYQNEIENELGCKLDWHEPVDSAKQSRYWIREYQELEKPIETITDSELLDKAKWLAERAKKFSDVFLKFEKKVI